MENATQALIIAAGVLVGILILSLAVYLFSIMGGYAANTQKQIEKDEIAQFNSKFLKYDGLKNLTIQDIITVKNYALENNREDGSYNPTSNACRAAENNAYIDVFYAEVEAAAHMQSALIMDKEDEQLLSEEIQRINDGKETKRFTCEVVFNSTSGRVSKIYFYAQ